MGYNSYEKHYLFKQGPECCQKFFPSATNCPYENTEQTGYYWEKYQDNINNTTPMPTIYNHTYYPSFQSGTCVNGWAFMVTEIELFLRPSYFSSSLSMHFSLLFSTDYPSWMASDVDFKRLYLFKKPEGCCKKWFVTAVDACVNSIIQGKYDILPCPTNRPECNQTSSVTNATAEVLSKW